MSKKIPQLDAVRGVAILLVILHNLHKIPFDLAKTFHPDRHPVLALPILLAACNALAALSWNLLEKPFLKPKRYFAPTPAAKYALSSIGSVA